MAICIKIPFENYNILEVSSQLGSGKSPKRQPGTPCKGVPNKNDKGKKPAGKQEKRETCTSMEGIQPRKGDGSGGTMKHIETLEKKLPRKRKIERLESRAPCQTNESSWPGRHAAEWRAQALQGSNATLTKRTPGPKS